MRALFNGTIKNFTSNFFCRLKRVLCVDCMVGCQRQQHVNRLAVYFHLRRKYATCIYIHGCRECSWSIFDSAGVLLLYHWLVHTLVELLLLHTAETFHLALYTMPEPWARTDCTHNFNNRSFVSRFNGFMFAFQNELHPILMAPLQLIVVNSLFWFTESFVFAELSKNWALECLQQSRHLRTNEWINKWKRICLSWAPPLRKVNFHSIC